MTDHAHHELTERRRAIERRVISPAQMVAGIIGLALAIIGGIALARVGLDSITGETVPVLGIEHTALMAVIDIAIGLLFLAAASSPQGRSALIGISLIAIVFGAVVAIEPQSFASALGDAREIGVVYLGVGLIGLLAAIVFRTTVVDRIATEQAGSVTTID